jgi:hypothetical protein
VLPGLGSPATFGWLWPQIVVPSECETDCESDLDAILCHELTHVQRRDALWNAFVRGSRNLLWFHPCVHHAFSAISVERELACDRIVVEEHANDRGTYAACLLRFARLDTNSNKPTPDLALASRAALLDFRVRSILTETAAITIGSSMRRAFVGLIFLIVAAVLAPALRILLTAVQSQPDMSAKALSAATLPTHTAVRHSKVNPKAETGNVAQAAQQSEVTVTMPSAPYDPQLAAAHRVGVGVVTQGSDDWNGASSAEDSTDRAQGNLPIHHPAGTQTSWTTVAIGAAEQLGKIDFDRDRDRH